MRGAAITLGMKSKVRDYGHEVKGALETDLVSGRGMSLTAGCREGSTRGHTVVVGGFPQARSNDSEILGTSSDADIMTNILDGKTIRDIVQNMGYHDTMCRSQLGVGWTRTGRQRRTPEPS